MLTIRKIATTAAVALTAVIVATTGLSTPAQAHPGHTTPGFGSQAKQFSSPRQHRRFTNGSRQRRSVHRTNFRRRAVVSNYGYRKRYLPYPVYYGGPAYAYPVNQLGLFGLLGLLSGTHQR